MPAPRPALKYDDLNAKQRKYVREFIKTADRNASYKAAGYAPARANALRLHRRVSDIIESEVQKKIQTGAIIALNVVQGLMENATSEAVKLAAAKDYLTRAGKDTPVESEVRVLDSRKETDKELEDELGSLLDKATVTTLPETKGTDDESTLH